jgi:hypothetical protein
MKEQEASLNQNNKFLRTLGITPDAFSEFMKQLVSIVPPREHTLTIPDAENWEDFKKSLIEVGQRAWTQYHGDKESGRPSEQKRYLKAIEEIVEKLEKDGHLRWCSERIVFFYKERAKSNERPFTKYRLTQLLKEQGFPEATSEKYVRLWFCITIGLRKRPTPRDLAFIKKHDPSLGHFLEVAWQEKPDLKEKMKAYAATFFPLKIKTTIPSDF